MFRYRVPLVQRCARHLSLGVGSIGARFIAAAIRSPVRSARLPQRIGREMRVPFGGPCLFVPEDLARDVQILPSAMAKLAKLWRMS